MPDHTGAALADELALLIERGWDNELADFVRASADTILTALRRSQAQRDGIAQDTGRGVPPG